jgi:hypothetical protein
VAASGDLCPVPGFVNEFDHSHWYQLPYAIHTC